jgi:hypothetical protein
MKRILDNQQLTALLSSLSGDEELPTNAKALLDAAKRRARAGSAAPRVVERLPAVPPPVAMPRLAPSRPLDLRTSSGRRVRVLAPEIAQRSELMAFGDAAAANEQRSFLTLTRHASALDALGEGQQRLEQQLQAVQQQVDVALLGSMSGLARLDQRTATVQAHAAQQQAEIAAQARDAQVQSFNGAVSTLQTTAYGQTGDPLHPTNLLLAGSQWLGGNLESVLKRLGWVTGSAATPFALLGPVLAFLLVQVTVGRQQHERFVSGRVTLEAKPGGGIGAGGPFFLAAPGPAVSVTVSLQDRIAPGAFEAFRGRTDIAVSTAVVAGDPSVQTAARVRDGVLEVVSMTPLVAPVSVVWTVDTGAADG